MASTIATRRVAPVEPSFNPSDAGFDCTHTMALVSARGLRAIAHNVLCALNCTLNRPGDSPVAFVAEDQLVVRVHHTLTEAERCLTRDPAERALFQRYIEELAHLIETDVCQHVQSVMERPAGPMRVEIDYATGGIAFVIALAETDE